jgi:hypothetical protein
LPPDLPPIRPINRIANSIKRIGSSSAVLKPERELPVSIAKPLQLVKDGIVGRAGVVRILGPFSIRKEICGVKRLAEDQLPLLRRLLARQY